MEGMEVRVLSSDEVGMVAGMGWRDDFLEWAWGFARDWAIQAGIEAWWNSVMDSWNNMSPDEQCNLAAWLFRGPYETPIPCGCGCN